MEEGVRDKIWKNPFNPTKLIKLINNNLDLIHVPEKAADFKTTFLLSLV